MDEGHAELLAAVDEVAEAMKRKLNARREKNTARLEDVSPLALYHRLLDEVTELMHAVQDGSEAEVRDEAADVCNFAMFQWVRRRRLTHHNGT